MRSFLLVFVLASTGLASAQDAPPADPNAEIDAEGLDQAARLLFESGTRAYDAGNFEEALSRYNNAYELSGRAGLLYNIAICHDRLEHKEEAADFYERFVAENPESPRTGVSRSRAEILRASLAADVTPDPDVQQDPNITPDVSDPQNDAPPPASSRSLAGPIAAFGVAGVGLITFAVSGLISSSRLSTAKETCANPATGCDVGELDGVDRTALIADIGLGVAIAGAAVGVILLFVGGGDDDEAAARTQVSPMASRDAVGAQLSGSF